MLKHIYNRLLSSTLLVVLCMSSLTSCSDSNSDKIVDDSLVTLKVILPTEEVQEVKPDGTRAGTATPGTTDESKIRTLRFLIYNQAGTTLEINKGIEIEDDGSSGDSMWDKDTQSLRIPVTPGTKQIYCIANWGFPNATGMPEITSSAAANVTALQAIVRTHQNVELTNPPVMAGSKTPIAITGSTQDLKIELRRQVARVELKPAISKELSILGTQVKITGVKFKNLPSKSFAFPQTTVATPSSPVIWNQSGFSGATSPVITATETLNATDYETKYYIPEYKPASQNTATVMIIQTDFNGRTMYYKVVIDPSVLATPAHTAYTIERNHTYRYLLNILGEGSTGEPTRSIDGQNDANLSYTLEIN